MYTHTLIYHDIYEIHEIEVVLTVAKAKAKSK